MDEMAKPMGEWSVEGLFEEMDSMLDVLDKKGKFNSLIYTVLKEIILRAGPPYEVYKQFNQLRGNLETMENYNTTDPEFGELLDRVTEIWEEIKAWYFA